MTKNAKGAGSIRQRSNGTWEARYTAGRDPGTGKQVQKSVYGKTQKEVRKKLTEKLRQLDSGVYTEPAKMTLAVWLDIWLKEYVKDCVKPSSLCRYKMQCDIHIKPALGALRLTELTTPAIQKFYNGLKQAGLSSNSIKNAHVALHSALKKAVILRYIPINPSDACELPRVEKKEIQPLDETAIAAFLKAVKGHKYELLYQVTLFTGLREGETLGLSWDCIDFESGIITVKQQLQREKYKGGKHYLTTPKSGKSRIIKAPSFVMQALRRCQIEQAQAQLKAGQLWDNPWNLVFTNEIGGHFVATTVYDNFKRTARAIGFPTARFHDLRHSYAVLALQSGDDVKTVQGNLGHHSAAFTLDVYGHVTDRMRERSAEHLQDAINGIVNL